MALDYGGDYSYANQKVSGSIVMYKPENLPVNVIEVSRISVLCVVVPTGRRIQTTLSSLDLEPIKLGYLNNTYTAHYLTRLPARRWRQGLTSQSCYEILNGVFRSCGSLLHTMGFCNSAQNIYPSFIDCWETLQQKEVKSIAFNKHFALLGSFSGVNLLHKGGVVGQVSFKGELPTPAFNKKYGYLKEMFEEAFHENYR